MKKHGFTLIGLAIAIMVFGILIAGGTRLMHLEQIGKAQHQSKVDVQNSIKAVIGNSVINNNTLPDNDFFQKYLSPKKQNQHPLLYAYDNSLTTNNICSVSSTDLKVKTPNKTITNVAFIIVSEGANKNMQTAYNSADNSVKLYKSDEKVDDNTSDKNIKELYDDVAEFVTLTQLQNKIDCSSHALKIINGYELPSDKDSSNNYLGVIKSADIYASGGFAYSDGYDWCIKNAPSWLDSNTCGGSSLKKCSDGWSRCISPKLDGDLPQVTSGTKDTYTFQMYVKDSKNTIATKEFSITIEKDTSSGGGGGGLKPPFP